MFFFGEMAELAEGARLLSECTVKTVPRVRIPLSPPLALIPLGVISEKIYLPDTYTVITHSSY